MYLSCEHPQLNVLFKVLCVLTVVTVLIVYHQWDQPQIVFSIQKTNSTYVLQLHNYTNSSALQVVNRSGLGYMFALHFSDQGTGAFINLMSFLCLSTAVGGVRVVEPFLVGSNVGLNVSANWTEEVTFSDVFNSDEFHRYAKSKNYNTLVPYSTFLQDAPRKLLVAQYKCTGFHVCRTCGHEDTLEQGRMFAKLNGFEMVGHVCLDYGSKGLMTLSEFKSQLYHKYSKSEVVVMFPIFGGLQAGRTTEKRGYRLYMSPSNCQRSKLSDSFSNIKPSRLAMSSADNYIQQYLDGQPYITAMVRFEIILSHIEVESCLDNLRKKLDELKSKFGIEKVALCLDVGKYGSTYFRDFVNYYRTILPYVDKFVSETVKEGMKLRDLDGTFTNATQKKNPGFVAVMQKVIAAKGDVLVLLGGGSSFQRSALELYNSLHEKRTVLHLNNSCV